MFLNALFLSGSSNVVNLNFCHCMLLAAAPLHAAPSTPLLTSLDVPASTVEERDKWVGKLQDMLTKERKRQAEEEKRNTSWLAHLHAEGHFT